MTKFNVHIITLFPECFPGVLGHSLTGRALQQGKWSLTTTMLRDFGLGVHKNVDDTPAGGGAGLVLRPDVLDGALQSAQNQGACGPIIALSPRGIPFTQNLANAWAKGDGMTLICGRFEGFDQRFIEARGVIEVSMGDFVLTGGEIAAQALIDATIRLIDGVIGNKESLEHESFSDGLLEHPQFTKPAEWDGHQIPEVLLSGHHGDIAKWRKAQSITVTQEKRPDLWAAYMDRNEEAEQSDVQKSPPKSDGTRSKK